MKPENKYELFDVFLPHLGTVLFFFFLGVLHVGLTCWMMEWKESSQGTMFAVSLIGLLISSTPFLFQKYGRKYINEYILVKPFISIIMWWAIIWLSALLERDMTLALSKHNVSTLEYLFDLVVMFFTLIAYFCGPAGVVIFFYISIDYMITCFTTHTGEISIWQRYINRENRRKRKEQRRNDRIQRERDRETGCDYR